MSATETSIEVDDKGVEVARNYAYILFGFIFITHFVARKKRNETTGVDQSHYEFQYRTTLFAWRSTIATVFVFFTGVAISNPNVPPVGLILVLYSGWLVAIWVAVRSIRGLYLCGARRPIKKPKSLWIWPE